MNGATARIDDATEREIPELVALIESAYRGDASRLGWTTEADLLDGHRTDTAGVAAVINGPDSRMLVAFDADGSVIGCCQLERRGVVAYFGMFAVRPVAQGAGLGKTILAEAERVARDEWGTGELHLTVLRQRADLIAWYLRRGFRRTGEVSPFPYGDERFGLPRQDDLEFEQLVKTLTPGPISPPGTVA